jgi:hypothetical protein
MLINKSTKPSLEKVEVRDPVLKPVEDTSRIPSIPLHEHLHIVGFTHTQTRQPRDAFAQLHKEEISSSPFSSILAYPILKPIEGATRTTSVPLHEYLHIVGFTHTQTRQPRDAFAQLHKEEISSSPFPSILAYPRAT